MNARTRRLQCRQPGVARCEHRLRSILLALVAWLAPQGSAGATLMLSPPVQTVLDDWKLEGPIAALPSPDGAYVYVTGATSQAINVFARNPASGRLSLVQTVDSGNSFPRQLAMSPDGAHLYVTQWSSHQIVAYARDGVTGRLALVASYPDGFMGAQMAEPDGIAVSPDGAHVYVGSLIDNSLLAFARDAVTGELTFVEAEVDGVGGVDGLSGAAAVAVSPDGAYVLVTGAGDDAVAVFGRNSLTGALTFIGAQFDGSGGITGLDGAASLAFSPGGDHVYVCGDQLAAFSLNLVTGTLSHIETESLAGFGCSVAMSPDGAHVLRLTSNVLAVYERDGLTGGLQLVDSELSGVNGVDAIWGSGRPTVSPDGAHVYAPAFFYDAVSIFDRNALTGNLTFSFLELGGSGLYGASGSAVSADGKHVYVAGQRVDSISWFDRDSVTGTLTLAGRIRDGEDGVDGLDGVTLLTVSPDGAHVYSLSPLADAVAVFARDATSGDLTFASVVHDGIGGVDGLDGPAAIAITSDGAHVYVAGRDEDALAVFERSALTGALTFVQAVRDGVGGVDGLAGVEGIEISADGAFLYAAGASDNAVAVFSRDPVTGMLTFLGAAVDGVASVDGLAGARSLDLTPDGANLYVASDAGIVTFDRDALTGLLTWRGVTRSTDTAVLGPLASIGVTPDGSMLYAVSVAIPPVDLAPPRGRVWTFRRHPVTAMPTYIEDREGVLWFYSSLVDVHVSMSADGTSLYLTEGISPQTAPPEFSAFRISAISALAVAPMCRPDPATVCRSSSRATLLLRDPPGLRNDRMRFRWSRGDATLAAALADPRFDQGHNFAVCIYDQSGGMPTLRFGAAIAGSERCRTLPPYSSDCWSGSGSQLLYRDGLGTPDGLVQARLQAGDAGEARMSFLAKGANAILPSIPLVPPVIVQAVNQDGECWGASFDGVQVRRNLVTASGGLFKGRK